MWKALGKGMLAMVLTLAMAGTALAAPGGPKQHKPNKPNKVVVEPTKVGPAHRGPEKVVIVHQAPKPVILTKPARSDRFLRLLPKRHKVVRYAGARYFLVDGDFYRAARGGYVMTQAPVGARVKVLPRDAQRMTIRGRTYARLEGTWFRFDPRRRDFVIVARPA